MKCNVLFVSKHQMSYKILQGIFFKLDYPGLLFLISKESILTQIYVYIALLFMDVNVIS